MSESLPWHTAPWAQGPCSEGQLWAALPAHSASRPCSHPWEKATVITCPSDSAAGKPCSGAGPTALRWRVISVGCDRFITPLQEDHVHCRAARDLRWRGCEDCSSSELSAIHPAQTAFNLSLPCLSPLSACRQCPQPCGALQRSCSWAELSLCSSSCLPCTPCIPGAWNSSTAEDQSKVL